MNQSQHQYHHHHHHHQRQHEQQQHHHDQMDRQRQRQQQECEDLRHFDWGDGGIGSDAGGGMGGGHSGGVPVAVGGIDAGSPWSWHQQYQQPQSASQPPSGTSWKAAETSEDESMEPLPFVGDASSSSSSFFAFARNNYIVDGMLAWSNGNSGGGGSSMPMPPIPPPRSLPAQDDLLPPGRVSSASSNSSESETSSSDGSSSDLYDDDDAMVSDDDYDSSSSSCSLLHPAKGVTFNEQVRVLPIPRASSYTREQRLRMYADRFEVRANKARNKREYEFDGHDWRNATEEGNMAICPLSGELLHPAHL